MKREDSKEKKLNDKERAKKKEGIIKIESKIKYANSFHCWLISQREQQPLASQLEVGKEEGIKKKDYEEKESKKKQEDREIQISASRRQQRSKQEEKQERRRNK